MTEHPDSLAALAIQLRTKYPNNESILILVSESDAEFDEVLERILGQAAVMLEANANHLFGLDEDTITSWLVAFLSIPGILSCLPQAHTNGHVDLTVESNGLFIRRRLGEAKIYKGPAWHVKGMEQLVDRYSTGREGSGFVVEYVTDPNIQALVDKIRVHLNKTRPCEQDGDAEDHPLRWAFITRHHHASGVLFRVLHLNCNLHRVPATASTATPAKVKATKASS